MRAIRIHAFGGPEVLRVETVDTPRAKAGELLIRVAAASVNPVDYKIRQGAFPKISEKDLPMTLGRDICGFVEDSRDKTFSREVIALLDWNLGGYAEYVALPSALCVPKPHTLSSIEAAAVPLAAMTAWQGLMQYGNLQPGERVLIHAGSGGVGHFAVQFAAAHGAHVISTASTENVEFVRNMGADTVIDYKKQRFEDLVSDVDMVFDLVGGPTRDRSWQVLRRGGTLVTTLGQPDQRQADAHGIRAVSYMTTPNTMQLMEIGALIDDGEVLPVVSKTFKLDQASAAQTYLEKEHPPGKVVLSVWADG